MILTPLLMNLAKVVAGMREDWPLVSIHRALCQCEGHTETEIALAAVRVAADPASKSPTRIALHGPWWLPSDLSETPHIKSVPMPPAYERDVVRTRPVPEGWVAKTRAVLHAAATRHTEPEEQP